MFKTLSDANFFLINHGALDLIDLDRLDEAAERLYREAEDKDNADAIISEFII